MTKSNSVQPRKHDKHSLSKAQRLSLAPQGAAGPKLPEERALPPASLLVSPFSVTLMWDWDLARARLLGEAGEG